MSNEKTLTWEAPEFQYYPKTAGWYITLVILAILAITFFIIVESDIFAGVCLALITLLIIFFSRQVPKSVQIELNDRGIKFGSLFYPYKQLKYFWVVHNNRHQTINFHTSALINNVVILELSDQDPEAAHKFLTQYLPEHSEIHETPMQAIMHKIKF
jgi:hypothetical protein